ncbi:MAG TPA: DUF1684 domain-containing protein [Thermoanaerobaculia bacterium]|jgi:hypothetical protein|nr:DUF1684 domain-containing protein [Thermoanaerobaculia bacterium]
MTPTPPKTSRLRRFSAGLAAALLLAALRPAAAADPPTTKPDYQHEIAAWRQDRDKGLRAESGWLTLVGLYWLDEGENKLGSDAGNKVIFPEGKAPAVAGTLVRHGKEVQLNPAPGAGFTADGKPVTAPFSLQADAQGKPTVLHLGSVSFFVIQRGDKVGIRMKDSQSPALAAFRGLDYFPLQQTWRVEARFEPYTPAKKIPIANVLGQVADEDSPGAVVFDWQGKTYRMDALKGDDKGGLFLIFADQTNGKDTYGAGRFLDTDPPQGGKVVVDFNTAYNPPCAFTAFATCPLPPAQNRLALRVEAGEKKYGEGHAH